MGLQTGVVDDQHICQKKFIESSLNEVIINMKPRREIEDNYSCSSSICGYNSELKLLPRRYPEATRIDRLYYEKYIPLRERKLLNRLIRTRAEYDDVRAQLVSNSTSSVDKPVLKPIRRTSVQTNNPIGTNEIMEIIDLVDRGHLGSSTLEDYCDCCTCTTKRRHLQHSRDLPRRNNEINYGRKRGVTFKPKYIRSDPCTCTYKLSGMIKKSSKTLLKKLRPDSSVPELRQYLIKNEKLSKRKRLKNLSRASYNIIKESGLHVKDAVLEGSRKLSKTNIKSILTEDTKKAPHVTKDNSNMKKKDRKNAAQIINNKSKIKKKDRKQQSAQNEEECSCSSQELVLKIRKDSIRKFKDDLRRKKILREWECEPGCIKEVCIPKECFEAIKLQRSPLNKYDHENIFEYKLDYTLNKKDTIKPTSNIEKNLSPKKISRKVDNISGLSKSKELKKNKKHKHITCLCDNDEPLINKSITPPVQFVIPPQTDKHAENSRKPNKRTKRVKIKDNYDDKHGNVVTVGSSFSFNTDFYKQNRNKISSSVPASSGVENNLKTVTESDRSTASQVNIEYKPKYKREHVLKRCFCTLKFKSKKPKLKRQDEKGTLTPEFKHYAVNDRVIDVKDSILSCIKQPEKCKNKTCDSKKCKTAFKIRTLRKNREVGITSSLFQRLGENKSIGCELGCTPQYCNNKICLKKKDNKVKSASYKNIPHIKKRRLRAISIRNCNDMDHKHDNYKIPIDDNKQLVRIGSSINFSIEFYKKGVPGKPNYKTKSIKEHARKKSVNTQIYKKERNTIIGNTLKRCFCTLKFNRNEYNRRQTQKLSASRETIISDDIKVDMIDKGTKIKKKYLRSLTPYECEPNTCIPGLCDPYECLERMNKRNMLLNTKSTKIDEEHLRFLEPYECEPYTCIPGQCDPYLCLDKINKRNMKHATITTEMPKMVSVSSAIYNSSSKHTQIKLEPQTKRKNTLVKPRKRKKNIRFVSQQLSEPYPKYSTRRGVRLGSSISFSVEFHKDQIPIETNNNIEFGPKKQSVIKTNTSNYLTDIETQAQIKQVHKSSLANTVLKRCFCTLNLAKNRKDPHRYNGTSNTKNKSLFGPNVYTVNRVFISEVRISVDKCPLVNEPHLASRCINKEKNNNLNNYFNRINTQSEVRHETSGEDIRNCRQNLFVHMEKVTKQYEQKSNTRLKQATFMSLTSRDILRCKSNLSTIDNIDKYITSVNNSFLSIIKSVDSYITNSSERHCYWENCYYAMNLQTNYNQRINLLKLKPYECEPGICVPGECDPYECQKLMKNRLRQIKTRKVGPSIDLKSISMNTTRMDRPRLLHDSTQFKSEKPTKLTFRKGISGKGKQAVRIGSNFNFNIEFYKKNCNIQENTNNMKIRRPILPSYQGTTSAIQKPLKIRALGAQVSPTLSDKPSQSLPKSCFCTLKLQKRGNLYKQVNKSAPTQINMKPLTSYVSRGQNTYKRGRFKKFHKLDPNECEPGICVPGECDPYKCLEIMKRRTNRDYGTSTNHDNVTICTNTKKQFSPKKQRTRATNNIFDYNEGQKQISNGCVKTKQAVHIGSSFSFNVEFFKDVSSPDCRNEELLHDELESKRKRIKTVVNKTLQKSISLHDEQTQNKKIDSNASTMTQSLLKRCFCTAKLLGSNKFDSPKRLKPYKKDLDMYSPTPTAVT